MPLEGVAPPTLTKLAQPMRVLLDKCRTKERLPKNDGSAELVAVKRSRYLTIG